MTDFCIINTPIGKLQIESNINVLTKISFNLNRLTTIPYTSLKHSLVIQQTIEELNEYFFSDREIFTINYRLEVSPFYKKVLKKVSKIPFGTTQSYKQIAKQLNNKNAYRAVGSANANNPLPIIIPCHRVIKSNGNLGDYGGGVKNKKILLNHENPSPFFF